MSSESKQISRPSNATLNNILSFFFFFLICFTALSRNFTYIKPIFKQRQTKTGAPGESHKTINKLIVAFILENRVRLKPTSVGDLTFKNQRLHP